MSASTAQQRAPWVLAVLLLSQVVLMSTNARHPESEQSILRIWAMTAITPVAAVAEAVVSTITNAVAAYADLRDARTENERLKQQVETLSSELNEAREQSSELERLRTQLALPSGSGYRQIAAGVVARNTSLWFRRLWLNRGTLDGIGLNMPVATTAGIVGRVIAVGPNFAQVQVITDRHAGAGAMLQKSRAMGELRGLDNDRVELRSISSTESVEVGETVVTTGLDRIYPKGLAVGVVERVEMDPNSPWHRIIVKPSAPVDRVEQVFVMLIDQKDLTVKEAIK